MKISIVYITNGKKINVLHSCIDSALNVADEVIVVGNTKHVKHNVTKLEYPELASTGQISKLRNIGSEFAKGDIIINVDDDIFFPPKFKCKLIKYIKDNPTIEIFNTKVLNINGSRYWDRAIHQNGDSLMIDYDTTHKDLYYSGAFLIRSKNFSERYKWDNNLKYYEKEDVEFSNRVKLDGYSIAIDASNYVVHLDQAYSSYRNNRGYLVCDKQSSCANEIQDYKLLREINAITKDISYDE